MIRKCPKCGEEKKITSSRCNVKVRDKELGSSITYHCNMCDHKWKVKVE